MAMIICPHYWKKLNDFNLVKYYLDLFATQIDTLIFFDEVDYNSIMGTDDQALYYLDAYLPTYSLKSAVGSVFIQEQNGAFSCRDVCSYLYIVGVHRRPSPKYESSF